MIFRSAIETDLKTVMGWISDAESCLIWAGPKVKFPLNHLQLLHAIEFEKTQTYSLYDKKELLALGQIRMFSHNRGHISRIVVNPTSRGKGVGEYFCEELINEAKKLECQTISLNVFSYNLPAIKLYKKLGFIIPPKQPETDRENITYMELG